MWLKLELIDSNAARCRRVTASFDARTQCESRVYEYCLPAWVFDPDCFPLQPGWRPPGYPADAALAGAGTPHALSAGEQGAGNPAGSTAAEQQNGKGTGAVLKAGYSMTKPPQHSAFVFNDDCCARLNGILAQYEGSHNFHNFSPGVQPEQMSAQRCVPPTLSSSIGAQYRVT